MGKYLSVDETAQIVPLTAKAIRMKIARREFPFRKIGGRVVIPEADLVRFLEAAPGCSVEEAARKVNEKAA